MRTWKAGKGELEKNGFSAVIKEMQDFSLFPLNVYSPHI